MTVMQGADNVFWSWMVFVLAVLSVLATWFLVITGRDQKARRQRTGEETIDRYAGVEENHAPLSKFLIWTYAGVGVWALAYLLWTGFKGLGD